MDISSIDLRLQAQNGFNCHFLEDLTVNCTSVTYDNEHSDEGDWSRCTYSSYTLR